MTTELFARLASAKILGLSFSIGAFVLDIGGIIILFFLNIP